MEEQLCYTVERPVCRAEQDETCEAGRLDITSSELLTPVVQHLIIKCDVMVDETFLQDVLTEKCETLTEEVCEV